ncbi:hypothetical protein Dsin_033050 [Dipteronia sinensis]|uniref:Uncharacterized protein n=1 Tax=Dipteronia sinensis TaxID=43782 RepID=A0AAD9ZFP8_9ROSI|nr:hypothetical protein Dsin_033050 [Dipteronia sinensis]
MEESCIARGSGLSCLDALRRKVRHKIVLHSSHYPERHHQLTLESAAGSLDLLVSCSKSMVLEKGQKINKFEAVLSAHLIHIWIKETHISQHDGPSRMRRGHKSNRGSNHVKCDSNSATLLPREERRLNQDFSNIPNITFCEPSMQEYGLSFINNFL